jgi:TRAP-type C4-dicarboxylate transport system permease small subunit
MNAIKLFAIVLLVAGALGLAYGGFSYTKDTTAVKVGSLELSVKEQKQVNIPMWAGVGAIVVGGLLLLSTSKRG